MFRSGNSGKKERKEERKKGRKEERKKERGEESYNNSRTPPRFCDSPARGA